MGLETLGGGYDDVQDSAPSNPRIGDTWLDTSQNPPVGKVYADLGSGGQWTTDLLDTPVSEAGATQSDIASGVDQSSLADNVLSGRTRELLLLMQDRPVPEVVDPMDFQSGLSNRTSTDSGDYVISSDGSESVSRPSDNGQWGSGSSSWYGLRVDVNTGLSSVTATVSSSSDNFDAVELWDGNKNTVASKSGTFSAGDSVTFNESLSPGTYYIVSTLDPNSSNFGYYDSPSFPYSGNVIDLPAAVSAGDETTGYAYSFSDVSVNYTPTTAYVTGQFAAPTNPPADFRAWNAIQAQDVTTGGSTSPNPVEFEILDSSDTVLTTSRIPASEIADEPFRFRERAYSATADADGDGIYVIPETGDGGHYGLDILSVVSVTHEGNVLDPSAWSFDGAETVTIDTGEVSISSGDTIEVNYDLDVFDSTLQPRAYLSRESTSETSPSISHYRYEYVI